MLRLLKTSQHGGSGDPGISLWSHYDLYRIIYWIDTMNNSARPVHIKIDVSPSPGVIFLIHLAMSSSSWCRTTPRPDQILTVVRNLHRLFWPLWIIESHTTVNILHATVNIHSRKDLVCVIGISASVLSVSSALFRFLNAFSRSAKAFCGER